ncbi:AAA-ATPase At2g18193-like [Rhododendron vialii]|uniref:AAA-ATPase At2g18193-like n=1 Tax=Rhododendron vialii TaxID=182163 RepID=UPI00265E755C|nr:AAA-ATPase At2g18193-like [Rhododendron vialii]
MMFSAAGDMQSAASTLFSAYASFAASMMLIRTMANDLVPGPVRTYLQSVLQSWFAPVSNQITTTVVVDEHHGGISRNEVYEAAEVYLGTKISPNNVRFKVGKAPKQKSLNISLEKGEEIVDRFDNDIELKWKFISTEPQNGHGNEKRFFELNFDIRYKDRVVNEYLPFVLAKSKEIKDSVDKVVKLYTRAGIPSDNDGRRGGGQGGWGSINLDHPATFETLAMDPELKKTIIDDLERFLKRKDFYKKVGKAWKRGYLLYGPTGTGKSSLIAAMANHLKFDVYDLELTSLNSNSELRRILVSTTNRSIIVIEDVDCSVEMQDRQPGIKQPYHPNTKLTLSGLLNFIDGLWSSCGDERIIIFTTNYKERLDPALLRPGRMDMHIHMSYCTSQGFKILASNYLGIHHRHALFGEIEGLIENVEVTPAEVAEELMKSEDANIALAGVVNFLKRKKMEASEIAEDKTNGLEVLREENELELCETKKLKIPWITSGGNSVRIAGEGLLDEEKVSAS